MKKISCLVQNLPLCPTIYTGKYALSNNHPNRPDYDQQVTVCYLTARSEKQAFMLQQSGR